MNKPLYVNLYLIKWLLVRLVKFSPWFPDTGVSKSDSEFGQVVLNGAIRQKKKKKKKVASGEEKKFFPLA